jgi:hypothetical protein
MERRPVAVDFDLHDQGVINGHDIDHVGVFALGDTAVDFQAVVALHD